MIVREFYREREEMKNTTANNNTISLHYFVVKIHTIDSH